MKTMEKHRTRLQQAARNITKRAVQIRWAAELELTVSPEVAAFAAGDTIVLNCEFLGTDGPLLMNSIVGHELAHITGHAPGEDITLSVVQRTVRTPWREWPAHAGVFPWTGHDHRFIRALSHVVHRLNGQRLPVVPEWAFCHREYGLSPLRHYMHTLSGETTNDWHPLRDVLEKPAPTEFTKFWTADVLRSAKKSFSKGTKNG